MSDYTPLSEDVLIMLGAYVDGALTEDERASVQAMADADPRIATEREELFALNDDMRGAFDELLDMPLPAEITEAAKPVDTTMPAPANTNRAPWRAIAASTSARLSPSPRLIYENRCGDAGPPRARRNYRNTLAAVSVWLAQSKICKPCPRCRLCQPCCRAFRKAG